MNFAKLFADNRAKVIKLNNKQEVAKVQSKIDKFENTNLLNIKWIGEGTVKKLLENWVSSQEELKGMKQKDLKEMWINPISLKSIKEFLKNND